MHAKTSKTQSAKGQRQSPSQPTSKPKPPVATAAVEPLVPEAQGSEKDFETYVPLAREIAASNVVVCRADVHLAHHNLVTGVDNVLAQRARIAKELPRVDVSELETLTDVSLGLIFAAAQVNPNPVSTSDVRKNLATARGLRTVLLNAARALRDACVFTAAEVRAIEQGTGDLDAAQDCVDLASLFRKKAALTAGKTAVTTEQIQQAASLGTTLLGTLRPKGAGKKTARPSDVAAAAADRDGLWTLELQRWNVLWQTGAYLFGRDAIDAVVPPLQSRVVTKRTAKTPGSATNAPGSTAAPAGIVTTSRKKKRKRR